LGQGAEQTPGPHLRRPGSRTVCYSAFLTFTLMVASFLPPLTLTSWVPSLASLLAVMVTLPSATLAVTPESLGASADSGLPDFTLTSFSAPGMISISSDSNTRTSAVSVFGGLVGLAHPEANTNAKAPQNSNDKLIRPMSVSPWGENNREHHFTRRAAPGSPQVTVHRVVANRQKQPSSVIVSPAIHPFLPRMWGRKRIL